MKRPRAFPVAMLVLVAVIGAAAYNCSVLYRRQPGIAASRLATVERGDLARSVVATGRIEPGTKVEIKSKANGIIKKILVDEGDVVVEGQVLIELDKEHLAALLREAQAGLQSAQANVKAAQAEFEKNKLEAESPDVVFNRRTVARVEELSRERLLPQQAVDEARAALERAENRQNVTRSHLQVSQNRIAQAQAAVTQAEANIERAQVEWNNSIIRSPIGGRVLSRHVEIGSPVSSILNLGSMATLIMVLGDTSRVYVRGKVDEADIGMVRLGQAVRIKVEAFKDRQFEGHVSQIAPSGIEKDNVINFEVKISLQNPTGELRANMTANAEIVLEEHKHTLIVPESAIVYDAERNASVEVPSEGSPTGRERRSIKVGFGTGTRTEVLAGVKEGDKVVLQ